LEPEILKYLEKGKKVDFSQDLFPYLLLKKEPMYGYVMDDYWCDIGDLQAYLQAHYDVLEGKIQLDINGTEIQKGVGSARVQSSSPVRYSTPPVLSETTAA